MEELERQKAALTKQMLDAAQSTINAGSMEERHDSVLSMVKKVCGVLHGTCQHLRQRMATLQLDGLQVLWKIKEEKALEVEKEDLTHKV